MEEAFCERCGSELRVHVEWHPYGDTWARETWVEECGACEARREPARAMSKRAARCPRRGAGSGKAGEVGWRAVRS